MKQYPRNMREFAYCVSYGMPFHTKCKNCNMPFTEECCRDSEEWIRATKEGMCGKCHEEIVDHLSGDSSV